MDPVTTDNDANTISVLYIYGNRSYSGSNDYWLVMYGLISQLASVSALDG
jgi:hypothetical protein